MPLMAIVALAGAVMVDDPQHRTLDFDKEIDLCANDPAATVPIDPREGTQVTYAIRISELTKDLEDALKRLDGRQFGVNAIQTNLFTVLMVSTRKPARTATQIRTEVTRLCRLSQTVPIRLAFFDATSGEDRRRIAKAAKAKVKAYRAAEPRFDPPELWSEERRQVERLRREANRRRLMAQWKRTLPDLQELDATVRREWASSLPRLLSPEVTTTRGRVREAECRRHGSTYRCRLGIAFMRDGEPDYVRAKIDFDRDAEGTLRIRPLPAPAGE